jgi:hypothetical protein
LKRTLSYLIIYVRPPVPYKGVNGRFPWCIQDQASPTVNVVGVEHSVMYFMHIISFNLFGSVLQFSLLISNLYFCVFCIFYMIYFYILPHFQPRSQYTEAPAPLTPTGSPPSVPICFMHLPYLYKTHFFHVWLFLGPFEPEDGGTVVLQNIRNYPQRHSVMSKKTGIFSNVTVRTSDLTKLLSLFKCSIGSVQLKCGQYMVIYNVSTSSQCEFFGSI